MISDKHKRVVPDVETEFLFLFLNNPQFRVFIFLLLSLLDYSFLGLANSLAQGQVL